MGALPCRAGVMASDKENETSLIGAPVTVLKSSEHEGAVGCVIGDPVNERLWPVLLGYPLYKTVHFKRAQFRLVRLEADEGNGLPFAVEEGSFNAFVGLADDVLRRVVFGACDHAAIRIVREAFFARHDWSFQEAVQMMRMAWAADVRRSLVGASAFDGGVCSAVCLCIRGAQMEGERMGRFKWLDMPARHDNATTVLMQLAFKLDDPSVLVTLYQWDPDWRIRKVLIRGALPEGSLLDAEKQMEEKLRVDAMPTEGSDGRGANQAFYVSSSGVEVSGRRGSVVDKGFVEDYTYEMAENHPGGCPKCVRWLRKRNETARSVFKARRAANLQKKHTREAQKQAVGHEAAQATFEEMCKRHDEREAAMRAQTIASDREHARRIATERESRRLQVSMQQLSVLPGPSHREPKSRHQTLRELGIGEQVAKQQWKEDRPNRSAHAEEKQRRAHDSATVRKQKEKAWKERQQQARRSMVAADDAHMTPPPLTLLDYFTTP